MSEPRVRAWYMKGFIAGVDRQLAADARAIRAAIGEEALRRIDESISMAWLPLEVNVAATHAVIGRVGRARAEEFFPRMFQRQLQQGWLDSFVQTGLRVLGMDPASFLKWLPRGYPAVFDECGRITLPVLESSRVVVCFEDLPPLVRRDDLWLDAVLWGIAAVTTVAGREGRAQYGRRDPEGRWIEMEITW